MVNNGLCWLRRLSMLLAVAIPWALSPAMAASAAVQVQSEETAIRVELRGAFARPGTLDLPQGARLVDALREGGLQADACQLQALWLRESAKAAQQRLKASVLYDLRALEIAAGLEGEASLVRWAGLLADTIADQPVTGRIAGHPLVREHLESRKPLNLPLQDGDRLGYPPCADTLTLLDGQGPTVVAYQPGQTLDAYAELSAARSWQAAGYLWVVHADGHIQRSRIGHWRSATPAFPGAAAFIFRPVAAHWVASINPDFNRDLARWLATQEYRP